MKPWRTFADPRPPKKGPLGPDPLFRGPPWKFLRGQTHVSGPSLAPLENPSEPNLKKTCFFKKKTETIINMSSGAFREKRQWLQNRVFRVLGPPWSPPRPEPFPSRPPRRAPEPALELPGPPRTLPRALRSHQGPHQIHKVGMLKT